MLFYAYSLGILQILEASWLTGLGLELGGCTVASIQWNSEKGSRKFRGPKGMKKGPRWFPDPSSIRCCYLLACAPSDSFLLVEVQCRLLYYCSTDFKELALGASLG